MREIIKTEKIYDIIYNADVNERLIVKLNNSLFICPVCKSIIQQNVEICPLCKKGKIKQKEYYFFCKSSPEDFNVYQNILCGYDLSMDKHISILIDDICYLLTMKEKNVDEIFNNEYFICNI